LLLAGNLSGQKEPEKTLEMLAKHPISSE
jgi:hypothetical protein